MSSDQPGGHADEFDDESDTDGASSSFPPLQGSLDPLAPKDDIGGDTHNYFGHVFQTGGGDMGIAGMGNPSTNLPGKGQPPLITGPEESLKPPSSGEQVTKALTGRAAKFLYAVLLVLIPVGVQQCVRWTTPEPEAPYPQDVEHDRAVSNLAVDRILEAIEANMDRALAFRRVKTKEIAEAEADKDGAPDLIDVYKTATEFKVEVLETEVNGKTDFVPAVDVVGLNENETPEYVVTVVLNTHDEVWFVLEDSNGNDSWEFTERAVHIDPKATAASTADIINAIGTAHGDETQSTTPFAELTR